ncbi:ammonium transporter [Marinomonas mediterranea]|jgi:ammonium transporter|uniref:Ammonium transporter n=1 Tax=Marinomonas mediterranea (strain ATCC 700492 / JCM 21426 / NBRC 103028 / MMB-1) TaxID=717774 RepID=F2JYR9_MARM1|nr:ammonium transporter [Marinomonas mediterranea]ADZ89694.1 ammonium transporter [Marinomonas mediterranea MMB-1]WCN07784.1 ammonium transporter [Marinomonas mediterranea]WCN11881.1 ammonium transporter [Marinomonas mediterranea]WCN15926.1 ammonium transporter [Marinomonas mediterranea MMB-1]
MSTETPTLESLQAALDAQQAVFEMHQSMNVEVFYWWCTAIMIMIHAGFLAYEMGASRSKNALAAGVKNVLALAVIIPTFYLFGWWIYNAFPGGLIPAEASAALPWSQSMGPDVQDMGTGIFWAAFALFGATTGSILSGAVIERIRVSAFLILTVVLGSAVWILAGAWGWHPDGWLLTELGYHDVGASGVVHAVAGFFTLGVLINLGARKGKFINGIAQVIPPHNLPMTLIGLMMIIFGFFGFLGGCIIFNGGETGWTTIYNNPTNLSAFAFNTLMGFAGGVIGCYIASRDPFWTMSGGLCGIISVAAGLDLYDPALAFIIATSMGFIAVKVAKALEKAGIDDAVGAVTVHGFVGFVAVILVGVFAGGTPNVGGNPEISLYGQTVAAVVMAVVGFLPGYLISYALKKANMLRVPDKAEDLGIDEVEILAKPYPETDVPAKTSLETQGA